MQQQCDYHCSDKKTHLLDLPEHVLEQLFERLSAESLLDVASTRLCCQTLARVSRQCALQFIRWDASCSAAELACNFPHARSLEIVDTLGAAKDSSIADALQRMHELERVDLLRTMRAGRLTAHALAQHPHVHAVTVCQNMNMRPLRDWPQLLESLRSVSIRCDGIDCTMLQRYMLGDNMDEQVQKPLGHLASFSLVGFTSLNILIPEALQQAAPNLHFFGIGGALPSSVGRAIGPNEAFSTIRDVLEAFPSLQVLEATFLRSAQSHLADEESIEAHSCHVLDLVVPADARKARALLEASDEYTKQQLGPVLKAGANSALPEEGLAAGVYSGCAKMSHPLHCCTAASHAEDLLHIGADPMARDCSAAATPLFRAAERGSSVDLLRTLVRSGRGGASCLTWATAAGELPVYIAALKGHLHVCTALIHECEAHGLPWEEPCRVVGDGWNMLHASLCGRNEQVATAVLHAADKKGVRLKVVNAQTKHGATPLHIAARGASEHMIQTLLKNGAAVRIHDERGNTPYDIALANKRDVPHLRPAEVQKQKKRRNEHRGAALRR